MPYKTFVMLLLATGACVASATPGETPPAHTLTGSWEFTLRPDTSATVRTPVAGLATFISDGTVIADVSDFVPSPQANPVARQTFSVSLGHGIWQPSPAAGDWYVRILTLTGNAQNAQTQRKDLTMTVKLNPAGDRFSGGYSYEILTQSGQVVGQGAGTVTGQEMVHPFLP